MEEAEFNWTEKEVVGLSLLVMSGSVDSFGDKINGDVYYRVGKHKVSGMIAIIPTDRNQKHEFVNEVMRKNGQFN